MCLDQVKNTDLPEVTHAFKVFKVIGRDRLVFEYYNTPKAIKRRWLKAVNNIVYTEKALYDSGFHCFLNKADAVSWAIHGQEVFKVKVRGIRLRGKQANSLPCIVCDEIFIQEKVK